MSSYIDDENDNSLENSMFLVKKRNSGIKRILKKYDINSRNRQNKDLKNLTLIKSDESFDSKIFRNRNSSYDQMSQDSNSIEKRYYKIQAIVMTRSIYVDKLLFPSVDECYVRITDNDIVTIERKYPYASDSQLIETFTLSPFRMHNSSKEIFSKNQEEIKIFSKLKLDINIYALRCIKSIINNEDLYIFLLKKIYESFEFNNILSKSSNIGLQNLKKKSFFYSKSF